jgi:hypothetical protein
MTRAYNAEMVAGTDKNMIGKIAGRPRTGMNGQCHELLAIVAFNVKGRQLYDPLIYGRRGYGVNGDGHARGTRPALKRLDGPPVSCGAQIYSPLTMFNN